MQKIIKCALSLLAIILVIWALGFLFQPRIKSVDESLKVTIPQKALHKNRVTISVEAAPGTECELTYISPSGYISYMDAVANRSGICFWTWKIDETKGKGSGRLIFTIEGISETHFIEIRSSF